MFNAEVVARRCGALKIVFDPYFGTQGPRKPGDSFLGWLRCCSGVVILDPPVLAVGWCVRVANAAVVRCWLCCAVECRSIQCSGWPVFQATLPVT
jgi:hypothetical protein